MDNKELVAQRINTALAMRGKMQKELAHAIGVTDNTISYFCKGNRTPNLQQLVAIAKELDVSTDYLLGLADPDNSTNDEKLRMVSEYTGLSNDAVEVLNQIAIAKTEYCANIRKTIDLLLGKEYSEKYWFRIYAFLYTRGSDFNVLLPAGSFKVMRDEMLRAILEQNNSFLAGIKSKLDKEERGGENGKH